MPPASPGVSDEDLGDGYRLADQVARGVLVERDPHTERPRLIAESQRLGHVLERWRIPIVSSCT